MDKDKAVYVRKFGKYELYKQGDEYVLTDYWLCDWFIIYGDGLGWAHDGIFSLRKDVREWFNKLSPRSMA
jgi:hypothetical protein